MKLHPSRIAFRNVACAAMLAAALTPLAGCVVEVPRPRRVVAVEAAPPPPPMPVVIEAPPPPPQEEVMIARPSAIHVWIGGYWAWREGRHVWVAGHWERPPRPHAVWVAPRWEHRREGYVFIQGFWR